jgi:RNA-directed DNA polymerase
VATVLAQICCHENKLPQGAPTSPIVSNIVCARFDRQLQLLAKEFKCTYTRYADDITFSTTLPKFPKQLACVSVEGEISEIIVGENLISVIHDNGFKINKKKIKLQTRKNHQGVTGLTVNEFPNVKREYIRKISSMLYIWDNYGINSAQQLYVEKYSREIEEFNQKGIFLKKTPLFKESLRGKINFLGMVRGKDDPIFLKYLDWYRTLSKRDFSTDRISEKDELPLVSE